MANVLKTNQFRGIYYGLSQNLSMPLNDSEKLLLDALKELPPNTVYTDAGKKEIVRGFKLYTGFRVGEILWDGRESSLIVVVEDGAAVPVCFSQGEGKVAPRCGCRTFQSLGKCEHVVCALLTVIHLLKPNLFRMTVENPPYQDRLRAGLFKHAPEEESKSRSENNVIPLDWGKGAKDGPWKTARGMKAPLYRIVMEEDRGRLKAYVENDGKRIESGSHARSLPSELGYLVAFSRREDMSVPLSILLKKCGNAYEIIFREGTESHLVDWSEQIPYRTWTEIDARGEEVLVTKRCSLGDDPFPATLMGNFALNTERSKMCYVKDRSGWELWKALRDASLRDLQVSAGIREAGDRILRIPTDIFTRFQVSFNKPEGGNPFPGAVFKVRGEPAAPSILKAEGYEISVTRSNKKNGEFVLNPMCRIGDQRFPSSQKALTFIKAIEWGKIPLSLRTKKRKPILYEMFFQSFSLRENRKLLDEMLKKAINERTFGKPQFATLARRLVRESLAEWSTEVVRLHLTEKGWLFIELDRERELALFSIPYEIFGPVLFERVILDQSAMTSKEEEFLGRLHLLIEAAEKQGIEVHLEGCLVDRASWEFELDAREGSIDWFEIRPEIRCNGETIGREVWEQALKRKGIISHNGKIQVLDEKTMETLSALAGLTNAPKGHGRVLKEIVTVPRLRIIEILSLRKRASPFSLAPGDEELVNRLTQFESSRRSPCRRPRGRVETLPARGIFMALFPV